ncbi:hypothetical protein CJ030_MR1G001459 [Morella rubra]|uniref:Uncharacterized protein n=1 Tax=Morella rubra TaxID=262757 RepID=A0A6A1WPH5_9ROSI|nr:hypothetical protein CJ030_MR1G001459 [Morella rubra]
MPKHSRLAASLQAHPKEAMTTKERRTTVQRDPINSITVRRSFSLGSGSLLPAVAPQPEVQAQAIEEPAGSFARAAHSQSPLACVLEEVECHIVGAFNKAISPIITSLAVMDERLSEIESRQQAMEKAQKDVWEDIMQRIDDVEHDLVKEIKKKSH